MGSDVDEAEASEIDDAPTDTVSDVNEAEVSEIDDAPTDTASDVDEAEVSDIVADTVSDTDEADNTSPHSIDTVVETGAIADKQHYISDILSDLQDRLPETMDREMVLAGSEVRKMRSPQSLDTSGKARGTWKDSVFYLDDTFIPKAYNEEQLSIAQIKENLFSSCGIEVDGIPFVDGVADFSALSIASIPTKDIVTQVTGLSAQEYDELEPIERTRLYNEVFHKSKRNTNFEIADRIIAERRIPIPGLSEGYTAEDLKKWRSDPKHRFTWDEQINGGYNLVPTIIHGNISHTGLVSSSATAVEYIDRRENDPPEKYSWDETDAPISIADFLGEYRKSPSD